MQLNVDQKYIEIFGYDSSNNNNENSIWKSISYMVWKLIVH